MSVSNKNIVIYPSGKLGVVTRWKNMIAENLSDSSVECKEKVKKLYDEYMEKVYNFLSACEETRKNLSGQALRDFEGWYSPLNTDIVQFRIQVTKYISDRHDGPRSNRTRSYISKTSSARIRVIENKAKLLAAKIYDEKVSEIEIEQEEKRKQMAFEAEYKKKLREAAIERLEMEQKVLEQELDNITIIPESEFGSDDFVVRKPEVAGPILSDNMNVDRVVVTPQHNIVIPPSSVLTPVLPENVDVDRNVVTPQQNNFIPPNNIITPPNNVNSVSSERVDFVQVLDTQNKISQAFASSLERFTLPQKELPKFDGSDLTEFPAFIQNFTRTIDKKCDDDADKLYYLEQSTFGTARDLVRSCGYHDAGRGYRRALQQLRQEFGNEYKIAAAYINKLDRWPSIRSEDAESLRSLSLFLLTCMNYMEDMNYLNQLNSPKELKVIIDKLPYDLRRMWRVKAHDISEDGQQVEFKHLVKFIRNQSNILNQPIYGNIKESNIKNENSSGRLASSRSFAIKDRSPDSELNVRHCECCKKDNHTINACKFFQQKSVHDRLEFVKINRLCFSCLKKGHTSRGCLEKSVCSTCNRYHPTVLHNNDFDNRRNADPESGNGQQELGSAPNTESSVGQQDSVSSSNPEDLGKVSSRAVKETGSDKVAGKSPKTYFALIPIKVKIRGSNNFVLTYAALDGCSTSCFMSESLLSELQTPSLNSKILLSTMEGVNSVTNTRIVNNLELYDLEDSMQDVIPVVFAQKNWPFGREDLFRQDILKNYPHLRNVPFKFIEKNIGLLIGMNMPEMVKPLEIVDGAWNDPYASRHRLGWALNGPTNVMGGKHSCHRTKVSTDLERIEDEIRTMFSHDYKDSSDTTRTMSADDRCWEEKIQQTIKLREDSHYEVGLPFKNNIKNLPNNEIQVYNRFLSLKNRFHRNKSYYDEYSEFIHMMITNGFVERVPADDKTPNGSVWYLTHHGVYHKQKRKLRVVFDCSLKYNGISINDVLLQGPDLINNLVGILLRFRRYQVALMSDIQKMFLQVKVPKPHTNYLRFFWFENNLDSKPVAYRLLVHTFGAVSSPSIANYVLLQIAKETPGLSVDARSAIRNSFYVDDLLLSAPSENKVAEIYAEVKMALSTGGFLLTGLTSNSRKILLSENRDHLSKSLKEINLTSEQLPSESALGVTWNMQDDSLGFKINCINKGYSRRGILSAIHGIYDPIGILGPVLIPAKRIFQETCTRKLDWNDSLPSDLKDKWNRWLGELPILENYGISRGIPLENATRVEAHYFSDGSETAYGAIVYVRLILRTGAVRCYPLLAKARLTPLTNTSLTTIPRIELNGARLSVMLKQTINREFQIIFDEEHFWTDSLTVLKYINNDEARYQRFVSNRVSFIRENSQQNQWKFVPGDLNPADHISRGVTASKFVDLCDWKNGPTFLQHDRKKWPTQPETEENFNLEVKRVSNFVLKSNSPKSPTEQLMEAFSSWYRLRCSVAWLLRYKDYLKDNKSGGKILQLSEISNAELYIWKFIQKNSYPQLFSKEIPVKHPLRKLSPFVVNGLLRVGGRLREARTPYENKHQIIIPQESFTVKLMVQYTHNALGHMGREMMLAHLRKKYWIIGANTLIRRVIRDCVQCRKRQGLPVQQVMAHLPIDRITVDQPPFSATGIDYFGPFTIVHGRKSEKVYGVVFTCLASRAMHLELAHSLDTDSFLNAFRRFKARRGNVKLVRSDNGTNFVSGCKEIKRAINDWNSSTIEHWMKQVNIEWKFQTPLASHHGGVWEREIRTIRKVLSALMNEQPLRLNFEQLHTLLCEVEAILNSRPITEISSDPDDLDALTPNHLLLLQSNSSFPPGLFSREDMYAKRRWRQVQYLSNLFWTRFRKEYLPLLQQRQKWTNPKRSLEVGDLVLVVDVLLPRNQWLTGRVTSVLSDKDGYVRAANVRVSKNKYNPSNFKCSNFERPISKLILLRENKDL